MKKNSIRTKVSTGLNTLSIAALAGATSHSYAAIVTNADLILSGFTVDINNTFSDWDIDGVGGPELGINASFFPATTSTTYSLNNLDVGAFANGFGVRTSGNQLLNLSVGAAINTGQFLASNFMVVFSGGALYSAVGFTSGESSYIGFKFDPSGSQELYGWAEVILTEDSFAGSFEVVRWAYDNSGADIQVGAIPEPASAAMGLGLLALGAAGLRRMRRAV